MAYSSIQECLKMVAETFRALAQLCDSSNQAESSIPADTPDMQLPIDSEVFTPSRSKSSTPTSFTLFLQDKRKEIESSNPDMKPLEVYQNLLESWRTATDKQKYVDMAAVMKKAGLEGQSMQKPRKRSKKTREAGPEPREPSPDEANVQDTKRKKGQSTTS